MATYRVQAEMPSNSGLNEDKVVNTFCVVAATLAEAEDFADALQVFYGTDAPGYTESVSSFLGNSLSRDAGAGSIKVYDLADAEPRSPKYERTLTLDIVVTGADPLPREVAAVLSFHADFPSGGNRARRRGRIYLGPLNSAALEEDSTGGSCHVSEGFINVATASAERLLTDFPAWSIYSVTDAIARPIVGGWMDNAFDTQRRRGDAATSRELWG